MKVSCTIFGFSSVVAVAFLFTSKASADCMSDLNTAVAAYNSTCSGTGNCSLYNPTTGTSSSSSYNYTKTVTSSTSNGNLVLSCQYSQCPPYHYPSTSNPPQTVPLCPGVPYSSTAVRPKNPLRQNTGKMCGSIVSVDDQTVGESIPIKGAKFNLNYFSHFTRGRGGYQIILPLIGSTVPAETSGFTVKVYSSDGIFVQPTTLAAQPNLTYKFNWYGNNLNQSMVYGQKSFTIEWTENFTNPAYPPITLKETVTLGAFNAENLGFGGWVPSIFKFYNAATGQLFSGDGTIRVVAKTPVTNVAGATYYIPEENGSLVYYFNNLGNIVYIKAGLTGANLFTFNYNIYDQLKSISEPFGLQTTFKGPDLAFGGTVNSIISPRGSLTVNGKGFETGMLATRLEYDPDTGFLASVRTIDGNNQGFDNPKFIMTYDPRGLLLTFKNLNDQVSTFTYDIDGNLIRDQHSSGYFFDLVKTINSSNSFTITASTAGGINTAHTISDTGSGITRDVLLPNGVTESASYGASGTTNTFGGWQTAYNTQQDARFSDGKFTSSQTISAGPLSVTKTRSQALTAYFPANPYGSFNLTTKENFGTSQRYTSYQTKTYASYRQRDGQPRGPVTQIDMDDYERPITVKLGTLTPVNLVYSQDLLTSITQGTNSNYFNYNTLGQLTSIAKGSTANIVESYQYDVLGRIWLKSFPSGYQIAYSYDGNGNMTSLQVTSKTHLFGFNLDEAITSYVSPLNRTTSYVYNINRSLTKITKPSGSIVDFTYAPSSGRLQKITTNIGDTNYSYNSTTGVISSVQSQYGFSNEFTNYGPAVVSTTLRDPSSIEIATYSKSLNNSTARLNSDTVSVGSNQATINYSYNLDLFLTQVGSLNLTYDAHDLHSGFTSGNFTEVYTRDAAGFITGRTIKFGTATIFSEVLTVDARKRVTTLVENLDSSSYTDNYTYDTDGHIDSTKRTYTTGGPYPYPTYYYYKTAANVLGNNSRMRSVYNTTTTTYNYNNDDQLTQVEYTTLSSTNRRIQFTYKLDGEVDRKTDYAVTGSGPIATKDFAYVYDDFGNLIQVTLINGTIINYEIDGLNRRVGKKVNGVLQKRWIYQDGLKISAELDGAGNILKRFAYSSNRNIPDYMEYGGSTYKIVYNHSGSLRAVVKLSDGSILQKMTHSEFGEVTTDSNPGLVPFGFAGGVYDPDTALVRFGMRDYDPEIGRWTAKDPIGFAGGDANLYGYVSHDPINFIDPTGTVGFGGAVIGFLLGGASGYLTGLATNTDPGQAAIIGASLGMVSGLTGAYLIQGAAALGVGTAGQIFTGAFGAAQVGFVGSLVSQQATGQKPSVGTALKTAAMCAIGTGGGTALGLGYSAEAQLAIDGAFGLSLIPADLLLAR